MKKEYIQASEGFFFFFFVIYFPNHIKTGLNIREHSNREELWIFAKEKWGVGSSNFIRVSLSSRLL